MPLFERVAGRAVLSDAGRVMVPYAERAVAAAQDAESAVRALSKPNAGPVALAVVGTLAGAQLSKIMKRFAREQPDADLSLRTATSAEVSELVRRGEARSACATIATVRAISNARCWATKRLIVVCASDHALAGRRVARLAELREQRWIAFPEVPGRREIAAGHILALFQTHGLGDVSWTPVDSLTAQKRLIEAGLGLALLSTIMSRRSLRRGSLAIIRVGDLMARAGDRRRHAARRISQRRVARGCSRCCGRDYGARDKRRRAAQQAA